ncbi:exo-alpha-sialidase [bacterium]|nr:exo-alpha-sialidase [bacterium]
MRKVSRLLVLAVCLCAIVCASSVSVAVMAATGPVEWDVNNEFDVDPRKATPPWSVSTGFRSSVVASNGVLHVLDPGREDGEYAVVQRPLNIVSGDRLIIEFSLRTVVTQDLGGTILLADGTGEEVFTFFPDRVESHRAKLKADINTSDGFHVYRIVLEGKDIALFGDGELLLDGTGTFTAPADEGRKMIRFGSLSSGPTGESLWEFIRYQVEEKGERKVVRTEPSARHIVIYKEPGVYACFPGLTQMPDGALYTSFGTRVKASHIDPTGGSQTMVSRDEGKTWGKAAKMPLNPSYCGPDGKLVDANGYGWRYADPEKRAEIEARGVEVRGGKADAVAYAEGCYARVSTDGGETWERRDLEIPNQALIMTFHDNATFLRYDDNLVMRSIYGRPEPNVSFYESWLLRSEDNGGSCDFITVGSDAEKKVGYGESALLKTGNGDILCMMRSQPPQTWKYLYQARSTDKGKTWSLAVNTGIHGHPPDLLLLKNGHILCTYGFREDPMGIRAVFSYDDGRTWDIENTRILRADGAGSGGDLGYPITVQLSDGSFFTVYYLTTEEGITHIAGTSWRE